MKGTYWYAVDYAGTGHLFTYKPERDAGIWNGEEALQVSQGALDVYKRQGCTDYLQTKISME